MGSTHLATRLLATSLIVAALGRTNAATQVSRSRPRVSLVPGPVLPLIRQDVAPAIAGPASRATVAAFMANAAEDQRADLRAAAAIVRGIAGRCSGEGRGKLISIKARLAESC